MPAVITKPGDLLRPTCPTRAKTSGAREGEIHREAKESCQRN